MSPHNYGIYRSSFAVSMETLIFSWFTLLYFYSPPLYRKLFQLIIVIMKILLVRKWLDTDNKQCHCECILLHPPPEIHLPPCLNIPLWHCESSVYIYLYLHTLFSFKILLAQPSFWSPDFKCLSNREERLDFRKVWDTGWMYATIMYLLETGLVTVDRGENSDMAQTG